MGELTFGIIFMPYLFSYYWGMLNDLMGILSFHEIEIHYESDRFY